MGRCRAVEPVLVGVDGSPSSLQAVRWAAREAVRRGVALRLVHAAGAFTVPHEYAELGVDPRLHELAERHGRAVVAEAAEVAAEAAPEVEIHRHVRPGYPIALLVAESHAAQLLVLGSRGAGAVQGRVGSVAAAVTPHAGCPVVVVPAVPEKQSSTS